MDQALGERLGVDARYRQREQIFDELIIVKACGTRIEQALAQACAMPANVTVPDFADMLVHGASSRNDPSSLH
jgi:hypothetical protein